MDDKKIEQQARLLCKAAGHNPDMKVFEPDLIYAMHEVLCPFPDDGDFRPFTQPMWVYFRDQARAILTPPLDEDVPVPPKD